MKPVLPFFSLIALFTLFSCSHKQIKVMPKLTVRNHSYSNYDSVKLEHLHLVLDVDFESRKLEGKAVLSINNHSGCNFLVLDTRHLNIDKVLLEDSTGTAWSLGEEKEYVGQALVIEIAKNTRKVAVYYSTSPEAEALMWLDPAQTLDKTHPFLFTQSQAILARTWIPCMDAPAVRFTYTAEISCGKEYLPVMSAENNFRRNDEGKYKFTMPQPIPSYLMALAVGNIEFRALGPNCGVFAEPGMLDRAAYEFSDLPKMIAGASELYGEYAWGRYDVLVLPPSFPFGGMENPRLTFATPTIIAGDKSLVSLVAHELAHSWSGNLVTNRTWDDFWLNEGFTVYFEERIMEKIYGKDYSDMLSEISLQELHVTLDDLMRTAPGDTKLKLNLDKRDPDDGVSDIAYVKGCMFLRMLEEKFGRKEWDEFLNGYFQHFKWGTVTTEDFIAYLEENLLAKHPNIKVNYKEWIYEIGLPADCPKINSRELARVDSMAARVNATRDVAQIDTAGFTTHHWLDLLRHLNHDSIRDRMKDMDTMFHLTESTNAEIQCDWYVICIDNQYREAYPYIEKYLTGVGRRKYLEPIYKALAGTPEGLEIGRKIFKKAESGYHAVSRNSIRAILYPGSRDDS